MIIHKLRETNRTPAGVGGGFDVTRRIKQATSSSWNLKFRNTFIEHLQHALSFSLRANQACSDRTKETCQVAYLIPAIPLKAQYSLKSAAACSALSGLRLLPGAALRRRRSSALSRVAPAPPVPPSEERLRLAPPRRKLATQLRDDCSLPSNKPDTKATQNKVTYQMKQ